MPAGIVQTLLKVLSGVVPVLDEIKNSIEETSGNIPKASHQLHNVTKATETATVEILNTLDAMTQRITGAEQQLAALSDLHRKRRMAVQRIPAGLRRDIVKALGNADLLQEGEDEIPAITRLLADARQDSVNIAMALQVQDITTQQIAGVTHLIESVRTQLRTLLDELEGNTPQTSQEQASPGIRIFDTDAQFTRSTERQERADEIINKWKQKSHE
jgi:chemotaxis regulatin CheY-phosphate phosphatase CheZ